MCVTICVVDAAAWASAPANPNGKNLPTPINLGRPHVVDRRVLSPVSVRYLPNEYGGAVHVFDLVCGEYVLRVLCVTLALGS